MVSARHSNGRQPSSNGGVKEDHPERDLLAQLQNPEATRSTCGHNHPPRRRKTNACRYPGLPDPRHDSSARARGRLPRRSPWPICRRNDRELEVRQIPVQVAIPAP